MLTGCQKFDSLLTRFYMHEFIKTTKLNRPFSGLTDQNMYAEEALMCICCKTFEFVKKYLILAAILDVIFEF